MQPVKQNELETPLSIPGDFTLLAYQINIVDATRCAYGLEDNELVKTLSSAKKCYHICISCGDENNAQFYQMFYWQIKAQISLRSRGI